MWPFIQVLIQKTNDYATFARSGYRGRLTIVTGQAMPLPTVEKAAEGDIN